MRASTWVLHHGLLGKIVHALVVRRAGLVEHPHPVELQTGALVDSHCMIHQGIFARLSHAPPRVLVEQRVGQDAPLQLVEEDVPQH